MTTTQEELVKAAEKVLAGLERRIAESPVDNVPVFDGIAELSDAISRAQAEASAAPTMREALELIEVDLTAGDMPAKTRVALALDRTRAALKQEPQS